MADVTQTPIPQEVVNNDLMIAKVVAMTVLGISSFCVGILPVRLTKLSSLQSVNGDKNLLISLLLCFGGGVLLYTTFIHLQPEVRQSFESLERRGRLPQFGFPPSELVFCLGFFFVYLIEEVVHLLLDRKMHDEPLHRSLSVRRCSSNKDLSNSKKLLNSQTTINVEKHGHSHHEMDESLKNSFGGFLAVLALSFHAVFEGLAVGLESSVQKVWYLFAAIATHKLVIGFCVGLELVTSKTKIMLMLLYIGTFALVTPLGIGIGIILSGKSDSSEDITSLVLQGMAAGTLLYVVFFEVLARERENQHSGVWQLLSILCGFAVMLLLQFLSE
ncbi:hypothetical protein NQ317_006696 [Molorchus minor]|uniref:Zinc transporter ZIP1 n=1 Tax=Molorchus minor TaxID=1323400 RepID=A0ABQ9JT95_9CUCU|nr:hypothetical protein NQ317_006696 [Molorchus minor]